MCFLDSQSGRINRKEKDNLYLGDGREGRRCRKKFFRELDPRVLRDRAANNDDEAKVSLSFAVSVFMYTLLIAITQRRSPTKRVERETREKEKEREIVVDRN